MAAGSPVAPRPALALACRGPVACCCCSSRRGHEPSGRSRQLWAEPKARAVNAWPRRPCEAHLPTECPQAGEAARVSPPDGDPRWPGGDPQPAPEGPCAALRVIWRIRDRASFVTLRREGVRARFGAISVSFVRATEEEPPRVAYAVGRRFGSAVARNRLRRRLREALAGLQREDGTTLRGGLYLVIPAPEAATQPFTTLQAGLRAALVAVQGRAAAGGVA